MWWAAHFSVNIFKIYCVKRVCVVKVCVLVWRLIRQEKPSDKDLKFMYQSNRTRFTDIVSKQGVVCAHAYWMRAHMHVSEARTFSFTGAEAPPFLARGGRALVDGHSFLIALRAGDFMVHVIWQVPQQTHAVLYQLEHKDSRHFISAAADAADASTNAVASVLPRKQLAGQTVTLALLSTSLQSIWDCTTYMRESTNPVHSLSFLRASLRSELTFL